MPRTTDQSGGIVVALPRDPSELPPPQRDGRLVHLSKPHSADKLFYWSRCVQEFARRTKYDWSGRRVCVDLFASCGIYEDVTTHQLGWGSPLLALHAIDPFDVYVFGEKDPKRAAVLAERIEERELVSHLARIDLTAPNLMQAAREFKAVEAAGPKCVVITGDANQAVPVVKLMMPGFEGRRIVMTMLDPYGVAFDWQSLAGLTLHERIDVLLLFPEDVDLERNWRQAERIDRFMPPGCDWPTAVASATNRGRVFRELYIDGMRRQLGLKVGDPKPIRAHGREIYKLIYGSPHEAGLAVWKHALREDPGGQIELHLA
jgi:three-Cys-motif partner protein